MSFKIGGIRVRISFLFFAMLTMIFAIDEKGIALITLTSAALHETGHIAALLLLGGSPDEIVFGIFGIRIQQNKYMLSDSRQAVVVLCGPLVNVVLFGAFLAAYVAFGSPFLLTASVVNLVSGAFNLLPIFPLDGGRILLVVLSALLPDGVVCAIMRTISALLILLLVFTGFILVSKTGVNISLLATGIYLGVLCIKSIRI